MQSRSPLKGKPLRLPGQSVQDALDALLVDQLLPFYLFVVLLVALTAVEWLAFFGHWPRQPWSYSWMTVTAAAAFGWRFLRARRRIAQLRLGRDGERVVGQFLEGLRVDGARVFHDVPGDGFNLDHVVLSPRGFFVIETKTRSKPRHGQARVSLTDAGIRVGGHAPDRDPIQQAQTGARWLAGLLEQSTGQRLAVRGVVVFPGWFVEPMSEAWKRSADNPWVLEPKALPTFIENESVQFPASLGQASVPSIWANSPFTRSCALREMGPR